MTTAAQLRDKLAALATKRAAVERLIGDCERKKAAKESEASAKEAKASNTRSEANRRMYLRQAQSARDAALAEGKKIAGHLKKRADLAKEEGAINKALATATKREQTAADKVAEKERKGREQAERQREAQRRADQRQRQQDRLEDELRRQQDLEKTSAWVEGVESRVAEQIAALREPKKEQLRIVYATAAPAGDLRVDEEMRRVQIAVKAALHRDQVVLQLLPAATAGDLLDNLTSFKPHVVHFSGHANESVLLFDDGTDKGAKGGKGNRVTAQAFKAAVDAPDEPPTLVVLNACKSAAQLQALLGRVPVAVGMSDSIGDLDAITFATRFYRSLADGQSVAAALATARADMEMNGLPDHDLPILAVLDGVDPSSIRLVVSADE